MTSPTLEHFFTQPTDDAPEPQVPTDLPPVHDSPHLASIAGSLRTLVEILSGQADDERESDRLREEHADIEAKHAAAYGLVEEISALVKPSTSKLAISVREAIEAHMNPQSGPVVEPETADEPEPANVPEPEADADELEQPPADAPIEEWVAFAQAKGLDIDPGRTNRSQIRTALGLPHFEG